MNTKRKYCNECGLKRTTKEKLHFHCKCKEKKNA